MIAFCGQHGHRSLSGLVVALFAGGSGVAGFFYGARNWRRPVLWRFRLQSAVFGVLPLLFLVPTNIAALAVCSFIVGLGIAPMLITTFALVERLVPGTALTEGLSWMLTGLNVGYGAGAAVVGQIADAHGARTSFWVGIAAALAVAGTAAIAYRTLRAPDETSRSSVGASEHAALP
jgi:predicted MFS family arabinose efflux permease